MHTWHSQPGDAVTHACNDTHAGIWIAAVHNCMACVCVNTYMHMHGMDRCMLAMHGQFRALAFPLFQNAHAPSATQHAPKAAIILGCIRYSAYTHQVPCWCQGHKDTTLNQQQRQWHVSSIYAQNPVGA